jgi:replicative DNA helicase
MNIFTAEQITIATTLRYGTAATKIVLPQLTPNKFVHSKQGELGGNDHAYIWQAIVNCVERQCVPTISSVGIEREYLQRLVGSLESDFGIYTFDANALLRYGEVVDKAGTVYQMSRIAGNISAMSLTKDGFYKGVSSIDNLSTWLTDVIQQYREVYKNDSGYKHVSVVTEQIKENWDRMYRGEQLVILPVGMPTLQQYQLFPVNSFTVLHGMSGSGKSAFLLSVLLGTALGLKVNNIPGCVAINSLEMSNTGFMSRAASILAGIDHTRLRGGKLPLTKDEYDRLVAWLDFVGTLPFYVDDDNLITSSELCLKALDIHTSDKGPLMQLGTDYTELFKDEADSVEQAVNRVAHNQFSIKNSTGCSVIAISQSTYSEGNRYYIAGMNGVRYSRGVTHAADIIVELWNPIQMRRNGIDVRVPESSNLDDSSAWLLIEKYRDGETGQLRLGWEPAYTRYFDRDFVMSRGGEVVVFDHLERLEESKALMKRFNTAVPAVKDVYW